jgi:hypothetical protein
LTLFVEGQGTLPLLLDRSSSRFDRPSPVKNHIREQAASKLPCLDFFLQDDSQLDCSEVEQRDVAHRFLRGSLGTTLF